jgi:hypothetical protein
MSENYTDFSLEDVYGGEEFLRHQTFSEVQFDLQRHSLRDMTLSVLKATYNELVENDISELNDYQSAKVVVPTNKARKYLYSRLPAFSSIMGCIRPDEIKNVKIDFYALAGGEKGLYLVAEYKGLRTMEYSFRYPEWSDTQEEPVIDENNVKIRLSCTGATVTAVEGPTTEGMVSYSSENKSDVVSTVEKGQFITYHITPTKNYEFVMLQADKAAYTDIKDVNDIRGVTLSRTSDGYEFVVTDTSDNHIFELSFDFDSTTVTRNVVISTTKCIGSIYENNSKLPFAIPVESESAESRFTFVDGDKCTTYFKPQICTKISNIVIDGRDYFDEYEEGKMFNYKGRTLDGKIFEIEIDLDSSVKIEFPEIGMDHSIRVAYEDVRYKIQGYLLAPDSTVLEKFLDYNMIHTDSYSTTALYNVLQSYPNYMYSRMAIRGIDGSFLTTADISVDYAEFSYKLSIARPTCDANIYIYLADVPKTAVITGECVNCGVFYSAAGLNVYSYESTVTTGRIDYGNTAIFRFESDKAYEFKEDLPFYGAKLTIDGVEIENYTQLIEKNIVFERVGKTNATLAFAALNGDHTFKVELTEDNKKPTHTITFTGTHTVNSGFDTENYVETSEVEVIDRDVVGRIFKAAEGYKIQIDYTNEVISAYIDETPIKLNGVTIYKEMEVYANLNSDNVTMSIENVTDDATIRIDLTDDAKLPVYHSVDVYVNNGTVENGETYHTSILEGSNVGFTVSPAEGKSFELDEDDLIDLNYVSITVNGTAIDNDSWPTNLSYQVESGDLIFTLRDVLSDYDITFTFSYKEVPVVPKYTATVVATNATVGGDNPAEIEEGEDYTIVINANAGTTFENIMFTLDKGTENQASWVIDLDKDSFNIFDREVEGVPQIENDGTVVRNQSGDHYVYIVNLKDVRNNYEIRFSTINIHTS